MPNRRAAVLAALLSMALSAGCREASRPNVLILVIDALRADRMGFAGYPKPTTPRLDELATESVWFRNAYAQASWTKPSIAALMTSRYPSELGLLDLEFEENPGVTRVLDAKWPYFPERLRRAGWRTGAGVNQVHLGEGDGFARGFDDYRHFRNLHGFLVNDAFESFLDGTRPLLAYVHHLDPHWPYERTFADTGDLFGGRDFPGPRPRAHSLPGVLKWQEEHLDAAALEVLENRYDAEVRFADEAAGVLFDMLRSRGLWEETIVVVTSDHGEAFLEHGDLLHGYAAYRELAHVPLLIRMPARFDAPAGARETPIGLIDIVPTLADLLGVAPDAGARGESMRSVLAGAERLDRAVLTQAERAWALRDSRYSVLAFADGRVERFDLSVDSFEQRPLDDAACDARCRPLESRLRRMIALLGLPGTEAATKELTPDEIEELRALGYL